MADTPDGETVKPEALENNASPTSAPATQVAPVANVVDTAEVERLRKEAEQKELRIRQLENEKAARDKAESEAKAKELEEQNQFKELYEQERTRREEIERKQEAEQQARELADVKQKMLADYPEEVKAIAEDTGLDLTADSEEAQTDFKARLDKIQARLGVQRVTPNNPGAKTGKKGYTQAELQAILKDPVKRDEYYRNKGGVAAAMMTE